MGQVVSTPNWITRSLVQIPLKVELAHDCTTLNCSEPIIVILSLSQYDINNVEGDVKHQIIVSLEGPVNVC